MASLYGRKHLGSILAVAVGAGLCGVALGPILLSASKESAGSYTTPLVTIASANVVFAAALLLVPVRPHEKYGAGAVRMSAGWRDAAHLEGEEVQRRSLRDHDALASPSFDALASPSFEAGPRPRVRPHDLAEV